MALITLLSDFGLTDPYVAEMKGVILSASPDQKSSMSLMELNVITLHGLLRP